MSSARGEMSTTPKLKSFFSGRRSCPVSRSHVTPIKKASSPRSRERNLAHQTAKIYMRIDPIFARIFAATKDAQTLKFRNGLEPRFPDKAIETMKKLGRFTTAKKMRSNHQPEPEKVDDDELKELHLVIGEYEADIARAKSVEVMVDEELHPRRKRKLPQEEWGLKTPEEKKGEKTDDSDKVTEFLFGETLAKARAQIEI
ncbi:unnamed protein product, partial [Mesorhabditis belari]|uniref:Uncharacterized protein n=1 Tax=Mesorhabditis belari TaxID=2138241 RepID=A0AAF3J7Q7_9BILA